MINVNVAVCARVIREFWLRLIMIRGRTGVVLMGIMYDVVWWVYHVHVFVLCGT